MMLRVLRGIARVVFFVVVFVAIAAGGFVGVTLAHFGRDLPDFRSLADYQPSVGSKVYDGNGTLIAELASEHRIPVAIKQVPRLVIDAFLAAEDRDFFNHRGVDPGAILRAAFADVLRFQRGQRPIGASTITQQVVRHFLLTNELSVSRKIREAMLAYRIERNLSKSRILEIYLNEIYLGAGAYGVAAAADTYFQKPLDRLTLGEAAFLAALPKAPNNYNPIRHPAAAQARRDYVIAAMSDLGWVGAADAKAAMGQKLVVHMRGDPTPEQLDAQNGYFAEEVRRELVARFGEKTVYERGLVVRTSYQPKHQQMAEAAFRKGLVEYDRRHGWRGPLNHLASGDAARTALTGTADPPAIGSWQVAAVTAVDNTGASIVLKDGGTGRIPLAELMWARKTQPDQKLGAPVRRPSDVVTPGDIVLVEALGPGGPAQGRRAPAAPNYGLRQVPDVSGGVVVMDPKTGRVYALVGGWSFQQSQFDRATQAKRQPGSAFKPLVFVTALDNGFTPSSVVDDAPIEIPQGPGQQSWQPVNYEGRFVGPTTLEDALIHSRNLVTARLATMIGLPALAQTVQNFDVMDKMPLYYAMSLGAGETTLLRLTNAYAMLDNGGHWLLPSVIDVVQDRQGRILYQKGTKDCAACFIAAPSPGDSGPSASFRAAGRAEPALSPVAGAVYADNATLYRPTKPDPLISQEADEAILAMMQGVVERGTGVAVSAVGKPLAGKTGTTSDWFDAWFVGFSPDLAAGVFVGFDEPRTLGGGEVGGQVAAPIFRDFMKEALKDQPAKPFPGAASALIASAPSRTREVAISGSGAPRIPREEPADSYTWSREDRVTAAGDGGEPAPPKRSWATTRGEMRAAAPPDPRDLTPEEWRTITPQGARIAAPQDERTIAPPEPRRRAQEERTIAPRDTRTAAPRDERPIAPPDAQIAAPQEERTIVSQDDRRAARRDARGVTRDDPVVWPRESGRRVPEYGSTQPPDYAPRWAPNNAPPAGPYYAAPGYGYSPPGFAYSPGYAMPPMSNYPAPGWGPPRAGGY
jgi:penicillin-binding protein 1A